MEEDPIPIKEGAVRDHVDLLYFAALSTEIEQAQSTLSVIEIEMEPLAKEETTIETSFEVGTKLMQQSFSTQGSIIRGSGGEVEEQLGFIPDEVNLLFRSSPKAHQVIAKISLKDRQERAKRSLRSRQTFAYRVKINIKFSSPRARHTFAYQVKINIECSLPRGRKGLAKS